ncbi:Integrase [Kosakonia radicincitans]|nr:Integrase [Kosakonia radicincitans]
MKEKLYRLNDFNGLGPEVKHSGKSSSFALDECPAVKLAEAREKCE